MYLFHRKLMSRKGPVAGKGMLDFVEDLIIREILVLVISAWCFKVLDYDFHCKNNFLHLIIL